MGSHLDARHPKQQYRFPLSPPSSGTVTALSSPRLSTFTPEDPGIVDKLLASTSAYCTEPVSWAQQSGDDATDSDGYITARSHSRRSSRKPTPRRIATRALTLPSSSALVSARVLTNSPPSTPRPLSRRSNSSYSSSSSSPTSNEHTLPHPSTSGMGRKVAATLQLFKETTGPDDSKPGDSSLRSESVTGNRRTGSFSKADEVAEPQFEFVKRSEWPDRETAAIRREKSTTALERVKMRDGNANAREVEEQRGKERKSSLRETAVSDLAQWRDNVVNRQDIGRGRRRERLAEGLVFDMDTHSDLHPESTVNRYHESPSPFIRPPSRLYPPSPSPSRSPATRIPTFPYTHSTDSSPRSFSRTTLPDLPFIQTTPQSHSRSPPNPIHIQPQFPTPFSAPLSPLESASFSPWSTDDESSTWETASATTTTSTTSANSYAYQSPPSVLHPPEDDVDVDDSAPFIFSSNLGDVTASGNDPPENEAILNLGIDRSHEHLPHIPLRPFRNQVGGHSAIYKFTKRAVCKVRIGCIVPSDIIIMLSYLSSNFTIASCITGESLL